MPYFSYSFGVVVGFIVGFIFGGLFIMKGARVVADRRYQKYFLTSVMEIVKAMTEEQAEAFIEKVRNIKEIKESGAHIKL